MLAHRRRPAPLDSKVLSLSLISWRFISSFSLRTARGKAARPGCSRLGLSSTSQAVALDPSVTSALCAANAARTSSFSTAGTLKKSRLRLSSAATSSNSSAAM